MVVVVAPAAMQEALLALHRRTREDQSRSPGALLAGQGSLVIARQNASMIMFFGAYMSAQKSFEESRVPAP
jgi:hypothetical protein